jgi:hypothetical protein
VGFGTLRIRLRDRAVDNAGRSFAIIAAETVLMRQKDGAAERWSVQTRLGASNRVSGPRNPEFLFFTQSGEAGTKSQF